MNPIPPLSSWKRLFTEQTSGLWVIVGLVSVCGFLVILLTRTNTTALQKTILIVLSIIAIWQMARHKNIDTVTLLLGLLGTFILQTLHQAEVISVLLLMIISGALACFLTVWQGHNRFEKKILWRHAYLVGFLAAEITALLSFFVIYDDVLAKAIIWTILLYVLWGLVELAARNEFTMRSARGYGVLAILLIGLVLATIKPILG